MGEAAEGPVSPAGPPRPRAPGNAEFSPGPLPTPRLWRLFCPQGSFQGVCGHGCKGNPPSALRPTWPTRRAWPPLQSLSRLSPPSPLPSVSSVTAGTRCPPLRPENWRGAPPHSALAHAALWPAQPPPGRRLERGPPASETFLTTFCLHLRFSPRSPWTQGSAGPQVPGCTALGWLPPAHPRPLPQR